MLVLRILYVPPTTATLVLTYVPRDHTVLVGTTFGGPRPPRGAGTSSSALAAGHDVVVKRLDSTYESGWRQQGLAEDEAAGRDSVGAFRAEFKKRGHPSGPFILSFGLA
jgi:hypothetical protein